jgi:hypothetical protein
MHSRESRSNKSEAHPSCRNTSRPRSRAVSVTSRVEAAAWMTRLLTLVASTPRLRDQKPMQMAQRKESWPTSRRTRRRRRPSRVYVTVQWLQTGNMHLRIKSTCENLLLGSSVSGGVRPRVKDGSLTGMPSSSNHCLASCTNCCSPRRAGRSAGRRFARDWPSCVPHPLGPRTCSHPPAGLA